MKLNPFAKKTGAYYAKIKAEYDDLSRQLDKTRDALAQAKIDHDKKEKHAFKLNHQGSMYYSTQAEKEASLAASKARNLVSSLESDVRSLMHRVSPLVSVVHGPQTFEDDKRSGSEIPATAESAIPAAAASASRAGSGSSLAAAASCRRTKPRL